MHRMMTSLAAIAVASAVPAYAAVQDQDRTPEQDGDRPGTGDEIGDEIVVTARSLRDQIRGLEAPIIELSEEDIAAYGANSIADLVQQLSPQTSSGRGRGDAGGQPVFLINGLRVSSFREFRSYPPEAIERVEVLPEEVAQRYGFPPDRRVINFIMKDNYSSREVELELEGPDRGGYASGETELTYLRLAGNSRLNFNAEFNERSVLTEAERDLIQPEDSQSAIATDPDPALYRSLIGERRAMELTGNYTARLGESSTSLSLNTTYERDESRSLSGLDSVLLVDPDGNQARRTFGADDPIERRGRTDRLSFGSTLSTVLDGWDSTFTIDASRSESESENDRRADSSALVAAAAAGDLALDADLPALADPGFDFAVSRATTITSAATFRGTLADLPAGELSATFDAGADFRRIDSEDTRSAGPIGLNRRRFRAGTSLVIPIAERDGPWGALGDVSLNLTAGAEDLSDFGTLGDFTVGVTWGVAEGLVLGATYFALEAAPSLTQLGAPQTVDVNVPVFDFATGDTVLATIISGGNPNLVAERQRDWKFSANWQPWFWEDARLTVEYFDNSSENVTNGFPFLTPAIEAAFSGRVTRDASGQLTSIDQRPVTFASQDGQRLSVGLTLNGSFGEARPQGSPGGGPGGRPGGGPGAGAGGRSGDGGAPQAGDAASPPDTSQPTGDRRAMFMAFRERLCGADGDQVMQNLLRIASGEAPVSDDPAMALPEGFDAERAQQFLARFRNADGTIDMARLEQMRTMMCAMDGPPGGGRPGGAPPPGGEGQPPSAQGETSQTDGGQEGQSGQQAQSGGQQAQSGGQGSGQRGRGGRRRGGGMFGGDGRGRYFLNITYNRNLSNTLVIAPGIEPLDLLNGDSLSGGGGLTRDSATLEGGAFRNGLGVRLSGRYSGSSRIDGSGLAGSTDLFFGDLVTFDIRTFVNIGEVFDAGGLWDGVRVSFRVDNIFDTRRAVVDGDGNTPLAYQPFRIDPTGRYVGIDLRKLF